MGLGDIKLYDNKKHYTKVAQWLLKHGIRIPDQSLLSDTGYMIDDCAVGFLFKTNSKQAYIDNIAADPTVPKAQRDRAIYRLIAVLEAEARRCGFGLVRILTSLPTMRERLEKTHWQQCGDYSVYTKVIGG